MLLQIHLILSDVYLFDTMFIRLYLILTSLPPFLLSDHNRHSVVMCMRNFPL